MSATIRLNSDHLADVHHMDSIEWPLALIVNRPNRRETLKVFRFEFIFSSMTTRHGIQQKNQDHRQLQTRYVNWRKV